MDGGFKDDVAIQGPRHGIEVEQVNRTDTSPGFVPVRWRWVVEQTHGTLALVTSSYYIFNTDALGEERCGCDDEPWQGW